MDEQCRRRQSKIHKSYLIKEAVSVIGLNIPCLHPVDVGVIELVPAATADG